MARAPRTVGEGARAAALAVVLAILLAGCGGGPGEAPASRALPVECRGGMAIDFGCHSERYAALVAQRGPGPALAELLALRSRSGFVRAACHQLMHVIGRAAGRRDGLAAFETGDPECSSGYYHGVVEAVTGRIGGHDIMREGASVCAPYRRVGRRSLAHYNCAHGMGHGFMGVLGSDVRRSLAGCDTLPDRWEREHCEGGVFMENLTAMDNPRRPSRSLRPEDPLYPCTVVATRHKDSCYVKQAAYPIYLTDGDFEAAFGLCAAAPDVAFRPSCRRGIGAAAVIRANKYVGGSADARATIRALCRLGSGAAARRDCVVGAVTAVVKDAATRRTNLPALCGGFAERRLRSVCARAADRLLRAFPVAGTAAGGEVWEALCHLDGVATTKEGKS